MNSMERRSERMEQRRTRNMKEEVVSSSFNFRKILDVVKFKERVSSNGLRYGLTSSRDIIFRISDTRCCIKNTRYRN